MPATAGVSVDLMGTFANQGLAIGDTYSGIENVTGTSGSDYLWGDTVANVIEGGDGNDSIDGREGDDILRGGDGHDVLQGGAGADVIEGGAGDDLIFGDEGDDDLYGGDGDDRLFAANGDDYLDGGAGNDEMWGGEDDDTYVVSHDSGSDKIFNFDESGNGILAFQGVEREELWFLRDTDPAHANDLLIRVLGTDTMVRVLQWYDETTPEQRASFKIEFIGTAGHNATPVNVESLAVLMATQAMPASTAAHEAMMAGDSDYRVAWELNWRLNELPEMGVIDPQEGTEASDIVFQITATDLTTPNAGLVFEWESDNPELIADVQVGNPDENGNRMVTVTPVGHQSGTANVSLTVLDANGAWVTRTFAVAVEAVATAPTIDLFSDAEGNAGSNIALDVNVTFPDDDGSEVHQVLFEGVPSNFSLSSGTRDSLTGIWTVDAADLDGLQLTNVPAGWHQDLEIIATARATENGADAFSSSISANVIINAPPTGAQISASSVAENAANGSVVGTITGIDPDGDSTLITLLDNAGGRFALDANGVLTVVDGTQLNYEQWTSHNVTVRVTDPDNSYHDVSLSIATVNVNEANAMPATYNFGSAENAAVGTAIGQIAATDIDTASPFNTQRYYFWNGSTATATSSDGRYAIDAVSGMITVAGAINYEATPSLNYTVIARDNAGGAGYFQAQSSLTMTIINVNEANAIAATYNFNVNENVATGTAVGTVAATDIDSAGAAFGQQRYYFWNGSAATPTSTDGRFAIDATTGLITTTAAAGLNYEAFTGSTYNVIARDNAGASATSGSVVRHHRRLQSQRSERHRGDLQLQRQ